MELWNEIIWNSTGFNRSDGRSARQGCARIVEFGFASLHGPLYRVGGGVSAPRVISSPQPNYPSEARKGHSAGSIAIGLIVGRDGRIEYAEVQRGISPELDRAAVDAVKMWKYDPAIKDGNPVRVAINVEVAFQP